MNFWKIMSESGIYCWKAIPEFQNKSWHCFDLYWDYVNWHVLLSSSAWILCDSIRRAAGAASAVHDPPVLRMVPPLSRFPQEFLSPPDISMCYSSQVVKSIFLPGEHCSHETQKKQQPGIFNLRAGKHFPMRDSPCKDKSDLSRGKLTLSLENSQKSMTILNSLIS